ncbi:MAG: hypothetical protein NT015_18835 [Alphaproteobacteria bacterium]|nr:hypothetical protein [Alphaproteobacteria bacterium]
MSSEDTDVPKKTPILGATALAVLIAVAIASGIGYALGDEITTPEMYARHGSSGDSLVEFWVAFAIAVGTALLVWLGFFFFVFRKRSKFWKALLALFVMAFATIVIAMPVRIVTMLMHHQEDQDAVDAVREREREERREIRARLAPDLLQLEPDLGGQSAVSVQEIIDGRVRLQEALEKMRAYHAAINTHLEESRAELQAMDIYSEVKAEAVGYYDGLLQPQSNVQRHLTATEELLALRAEFATYLIDHRSAWIIEEGRVTFVDRAAWLGAQERNEVMDELQRDIDRLDGALGRQGEKPLFGASEDDSN